VSGISRPGVKNGCLIWIRVGCAESILENDPILAVSDAGFAAG
jgi:hypothetical protein